MPYFFKKYYSPRKVFFFFGEGILIFVTLLIANYYFLERNLFYTDLMLYLTQVAMVTFTFQLCLYFFDLYDLGDLLSLSNIIVRIIQAFGIGIIALAIFYYIFPLFMIPNRIFMPGFAVICFSVFTWRFCYNHIIRKKMFAKSVVIIGSGKIAFDIASEIQAKSDTGFEIACFIGTPEPDYSMPPTIPLLPNVGDLPQICEDKQIDQVVVALDNPRGHTPIKQLMTCKFAGYPVEHGIKFFERLTGKILVENVKPGEIIFSAGFKKTKWQTNSKQVIDMTLSVIGIIVTLPITLLSAIIIRLESPGPIFYTQERVGLYGKTFKVIKFRSMRQDAEKDGPVYAKKDDDRVTRYGGFMRKTRIDELPQMINVFKGEMSFVGPRPERPVFVDQLALRIPYYSIRHNVMPGITGWAQICYPYGDSEEDALRKLEYDLYYIKYMSIQMDLSIIFQTLKTVLFRKGSR